MQEEHREPQIWQAQEAAHHARIDTLTARVRERAERGVSHPVDDFLFTYYRQRPGKLRRWHPGPGVILVGDISERAGWRHYHHDHGQTRLDVASFLGHRGDTVRFVRDLLAATASRRPSFRCFGLHEWAMVHGQRQHDIRHAAWPLRLSPAETDAVAESRPIRCTHYDAYRFFTPSARSLNQVTPTRDTQSDLEQPGCLHATMDLYKWAVKLSPGVASDLVVRSLELAWRAREVDMRAAPYDLSALGYEPIRVETARGRAEYVEQQRRVADDGAALRSDLMAACARLLTTERELTERSPE